MMMSWWQLWNLYNAFDDSNRGYHKDHHDGNDNGDYDDDNGGRGPKSHIWDFGHLYGIMSVINMHLCTYGILGAYHIGNDTDGDDDDDNCGQLWAVMTSNAWVDDVNVAPFPLSVDEHLFSSNFGWGVVFKNFWTIICFQVYLDEHLISSSFDEHLFSSIFISQFEKLECLMFCH